MKTKKSLLTIILLLAFVLSFPVMASAKTDEYGYNAKARTFKGTMDNWEAFLAGTTPTPYDPKGTDIVFVERSWNRLFDPMIHGDKPICEGAWQKAKLWEYLSGDQLGWSWHLELEILYSPCVKIPEAMEVPAEAMGGYNGFYLIKQKEWLSGPDGEKEMIQDFSVAKSIINQVLHFGKSKLVSI